MKTVYVSLTVLLVIAMIGMPMANHGPFGADVAQAQVSVPSDIAVQLTTLRQTDNVRYTITIINPSDRPLPGLTTLVELPSSANLVQALETEGFSHFLGALPHARGQNLYWSANFGAGDYVDAFIFTLDAPVDSAIGVNLKWAGDQPGQVEFWGLPAVLAANQVDSDLALSAAGTGDSLVPVGATGVLVGVAQGQVQDGTKIHFRVMDPSEDPTDSGDLWWCSAVEVTGLPAGAQITVLVPLREPLPPGAPVALFTRQTGGDWVPMAAQGIVTFDGQHVAYAHLGGSVATGIQSKFQPQAPKPPINPTSVPPIRVPPTAVPAKPTTASQPTHVPATAAPAKPTTASQPTRVPPTAVRIVPTIPGLTVLKGTPTKVLNQPTRTPTPQLIRATKPIPTAPPPTATAANKSVVATATVATTTAASACKQSPGALCFGPGGSSLISLCSQAGVNCISTGKDGTICFALTVGGRQQCTTPGSTVIFSPGHVSVIPFIPSETPLFKRTLGATNIIPQVVPTKTQTPVVIIVTATFVPQPTICVQDTAGNIDCTNQNGQLVPLPTATLRADGGECFNISANSLFGTVTFTLCVDASGVECFQAPPVGFDTPFGCLGPNDPGYITPP